MKPNLLRKTEKGRFHIFRPFIASGSAPANGSELCFQDLSGTTSSSWSRMLWRSSENMSAASNKVAAASRDALSILDAIRSIDVAPADPALSLDASRQIEAALLDVRHAPIETVRDAHAKCSVLRAVVALLPADDPRVQAFALALALELADFVGRPRR